MGAGYARNREVPGYHGPALLRGDVGAPASDGDDQSFGAQRLDGLADGAAGDAVFSHELAFRRQRITRPVLT